MSKRISIHSIGEYVGIIESLKITSTIEFNSTVFTVGESDIFGAVIGVSNAEECFIITG